MIMKKVPISLIIDDPAPLISVYYVHAIFRAVKDVSGSDVSWYFLHGLYNTPGVKPWVALEEILHSVLANKSAYPKPKF